MPYYHVRITYAGKKGEESDFFKYNASEELVKERIAAPFMKNKSFVVSGRVYHPSKIDKITIFNSRVRAEDLILPNRKSPFGQSHDYVTICFIQGKVKGVHTCTDYFITSPPEEKAEQIKTPTESLGKKEEPTDLTIGLMQSVSFLGFDTNWSSATCALQLQEVAVTLVAKKKGITLDKANVEKILKKKIEDLSFNDQYEAFSIQVKGAFNIEMPILTGHLRKMRAKVLHEGYNPQPEETESIVSFTIGLLQKIKSISEAT